MNLSMSRVYRGDYDGAEGPRLQTLRQAAQLGATYIDIEYAAHEAFGAREDPLPQHTQLIMSHHNFERTLPKAELQQIEAGMRAAGADIAKIAMAAEDISDAWTMIELLKEKSGAQTLVGAALSVLCAGK